MGLSLRSKMTNTGGTQDRPSRNLGVQPPKEDDLDSILGGGVSGDILSDNGKVSPLIVNTDGRSTLEEEMTEKALAGKPGRPSTVKPEKVEMLRILLLDKGMMADGELVTTKSKAIRYLHDQNASVAEIATVLDVLYQHAYNVVTQYKQFKESLPKKKDT